MFENIHRPFCRKASQLFSHHDLLPRHVDAIEVAGNLDAAPLALAPHAGVGECDCGPGSLLDGVNVAAVAAFHEGLVVMDYVR